MVQWASPVQLCAKAKRKARQCWPYRVVCDAVRLVVFFLFGTAQYVQACCKVPKQYKAKQAIDFVLHA